MRPRPTPAGPSQLGGWGGLDFLSDCVDFHENTAAAPRRALRYTLLRTHYSQSDSRLQQPKSEDFTQFASMMRVTLERDDNIT